MYCYYCTHKNYCKVQRKPKLQPYDAFLKKFEHKKALDAALQVRGGGGSRAPFKAMVLILYGYRVGTLW